MVSDRREFHLLAGYRFHQSSYRAETSIITVPGEGKYVSMGVQNTRFWPHHHFTHGSFSFFFIRAIGILGVGIAVIVTLCCLTGLVIYAAYHDCDPLTTQVRSNELSKREKKNFFNSSFV